MRSRWRLIDLLGIALIVGALLFGVWRFAGEDAANREKFDALLQDVRSSVASAAAPVQPAAQAETEAPLPPAPGNLGDPPDARLVYPHIVRSASKGVLEAKHSFDFEGTRHTVDVGVPKSLYDGARDSERSISTVPGESEDEQQVAYYRFMVQDREQAPLVAKVAKKLRKIAEREGLGRDRYAELISKYVQTMPYDYAKLEAADPKTRFPVETLVDGTGVCGDKSLLLAALLAHEGYQVSLLTFTPEKHMAVGIRGSGQHYGATSYLFIESTSPAYLSEIPRNFVSGIKLTSEPLIVPIGTGKTSYSSAEKVAHLIAVRESAKEARDRLYEQASALQLTPGQAKQVNSRLQTAYLSQFRLSWIDGHEDEFLDRRAARRWVDKNVWWD